MVFFTLIVQDELGCDTTIGSRYRQRDVRSYSKIGMARQKRTWFQNELNKKNIPATVRILQTVILADGTIRSEFTE